VRAAVDLRMPPEGSKGIEAMLQEVRARLVRLAPEEAYAELVATWVAMTHQRSWWILGWQNRGSGKGGLGDH
jgi:hypothetical protein